MGKSGEEETMEIFFIMIASPLVVWGCLIFVSKLIPATIAFSYIGWKQHNFILVG